MISAMKISSNLKRRMRTCIYIHCDWRGDYKRCEAYLWVSSVLKLKKKLKISKNVHFDISFLNTI